MKTTHLLLAAVALMPVSRAQAPSVLVLEGTTVPGVGAVTSIDNVVIAESGSWLVEVDTDNPDLDADGALLGPSGLVLREGQALLEPGGATLDSFDGISLNENGTTAFNLFLDGTSGTNTDSGVYRGDQLLIQEGQISTAGAFSPGTPYIGFFDVKVTSNDRILVVASIDDAAIASSVDRALVLLFSDAAGNLTGETVLYKEGDVPPGQTEAIADFETGVHHNAVNSSGNVLWAADLAGSSSSDGVVYLGSTLLAQEGSPSPVAGRNWGSLTDPELDLADTGFWVAKLNLDSSNTANDLVVVRNGAILAREGQVFADIAPFAVEDFGTSTGVFVTPWGAVLWFADWDDPDQTRDEGIFINDQLLVQEGVTQVNGMTLIDLSDIEDGLRMSPDGRFAIFEGTLSTPAGPRDGAFLLPLDLGSTYCTGNANSTGVGALTRATGSALVTENSLTLAAVHLPTNTFAFFITSASQGFIPNPGGSQGTLCLGGSIGRFNSSVQSSGATGTVTRPVDLNQFPQPGGPVAVLPGQTWRFQCWYRDLNPAPTSNFSAGTFITFQ